MILSREQVKSLRRCAQGEFVFLSCKDCAAYEDGCLSEATHYIDTIEHLQAELDRRELEHEKARRAVEMEFRETLDFMNSTVRLIEAERDRLKAELELAIETKEKLQEILEEYAEAGL